MNITLVGLGMGAPELLTPQGHRALLRAEAVIGAQRLLDTLPADCRAARHALINTEEIARWIQEHTEYRDICVAFSGDTGFYSGATRLRPLLVAQGHTVESVCGIATPVYLCAKAGVPWQDVHLVSAHGRDCDPLAHILNYPDVFYLTGGAWDAGRICSAIAAAGLYDVDITIGERLSYPDERIITGDTGTLCGQDFAPLSAVLARRRTPTFRYNSRAGGIPDNLFARGEVPMTKREARAVILSMLAPAETDILWDIGAGTGSVAVEMALCARWGRVYAVERGAAGCALINENRQRFGVYNLTCVEMAAPGACAWLRPPDAVFIGGSGGCLEDIVRIALEQNPRARIVISAVTLETMAAGLAALERHGCVDIEAVQIAASRAQAVGRSHLLKAQNPIFIMAGRGAE